MAKDNDKKYWVAFAMIPGFGPAKFRRLLAIFPDLKSAWLALPKKFTDAGLSDFEIKKITRAQADYNVDAGFQSLSRLGIDAITWDDNTYPSLLKEISQPPAVLFCRGNLPDKWEESVAVVGTRKTSLYGRQVSRDLVSDLARAGLVIVSGLALGIDALAHQACLESGGQTIAVLGSGLDKIYPAANRQLARTIIDNGGCLLSEYPPGTSPLKQHFPARNRIIAGLTPGVLVIEGGADSGSLITAMSAADENREIFAVPGNISSPTAAGPNKLIKLGANIVTAAQDVLNNFSINSARRHCGQKKNPPVSPEEKIILDFLATGPKHIDEIIRQCKLNTSITNSVLTLLVIKGLISDLGGQHYATAPG